MENPIKAEYHEGENGYYFTYTWNCPRCGEEQCRRSVPRHKYCCTCKCAVDKEREKERKAEAKKNAEAKAMKTCVSLIKKKFDYKKLPSINIDGKRFLSEEAVKETIESIINDN